MPLVIEAPAADVEVRGEARDDVASVAPAPAPSVPWEAGAVEMAGWADAQEGKFHPAFTRPGKPPGTLAVRVTFLHAQLTPADLGGGGLAAAVIRDALARARDEYAGGPQMARLRLLELRLAEAVALCDEAARSADVQRRACALALTAGDDPTVHERARADALSAAIVLGERVETLKGAAVEARADARRGLRELLEATRRGLLDEGRRRARAELARATAAAEEAAGRLLVPLLAARAEVEALAAWDAVRPAGDLLELPDSGWPGSVAGGVGAGNSLSPAVRVIRPSSAAEPARPDPVPAAADDDKDENEPDAPVGSPRGDLAAFLAERCVTGAGQQVRSQELFATWQTWCAERGLDAGLDSTFAKDLRRLVPALEVKQPRIDGERPRVLAGVGLVRHEVAALAAVEG